MLAVMSSDLLAGSVMRSALHVAEVVKPKTDTVAGSGYLGREKDRGIHETRADLQETRQARLLTLPCQRFRFLSAQL
jgi:hypothetical protein